MIAACLSGENRRLYSPSSFSSMANRPWASVMALSSRKSENLQVIRPSRIALWQHTWTGTPTTGEPFSSTATPAMIFAAAGDDLIVVLAAHALDGVRAIPRAGRS